MRRSLVSAGIVSIALLFGTFSGAAFAGSSKPVFSETTFDAGQVGNQSEILHDFPVQNTGDAPLRITEVRPSCGCTVVEYDKVIAPGQSGRVRARVRLKDLPAGRASKTLVVITDSTEADRTVLQVKFDYQPPLEFLIKNKDRKVYLATTAGEERVEKILVRPHLPGMKITGVTSSNPLVKVRLEPATPSGRKAEGLVSMLLPREGDFWIDIRVPADAPVGPVQSEINVQTSSAEYPSGGFNVEALVREAKPAAPDAP